MRKLALTEFLTIDGVMEAPHLWNSPFFDEESGAYKLNEVRATDALLLGRVTYEGFAAAWPGRTDEQGFADRFNSIPKYVVSTTLTDPTWNNSHVISDNLVQTVQTLKEEDGQDIVVHGSGTLANSLMAANLIDEYRLMVSPVVLGRGQRLFLEGISAPDLELVDVKSFPRGNVVLTYRSKATGDTR
jgi:dihydrofolate reductase